MICVTSKKKKISSSVSHITLRNSFNLSFCLFTQQTGSALHYRCLKSHIALLPHLSGLAHIQLLDLYSISLPTPYLLSLLTSAPHNCC